MGVLKQAFCPGERNKCAAAQPGWLQHPGLPLARLASLPLIPLSQSPTSLLVSAFQALHGGLAELWVAGLICSLKEKACREVPTVSLPEERDKVW